LHQLLIHRFLVT